MSNIRKVAIIAAVAAGGIACFVGGIVTTICIVARHREKFTDILGDKMSDGISTAEPEEPIVPKDGANHDAEASAPSS